MIARKSHSVSKKQRAVAYFEEDNGIKSTAREFGVAPKQIREWKKKKAKLLRIKAKQGNL